MYVNEAQFYPDQWLLSTFVVSLVLYMDMDISHSGPKKCDICHGAISQCFFHGNLMFINTFYTLSQLKRQFNECKQQNFHNFGMKILF
jgi:hypothetical protein